MKTSLSILTFIFEEFDYGLVIGPLVCAFLLIGLIGGVTFAMKRIAFEDDPEREHETKEDYWEKRDRLWKEQEHWVRNRVIAVTIITLLIIVWCYLSQ